MKHEPMSSPGASSLSSLFDDFRLIGSAIADALRGPSTGSTPDCRCTKIHYAGWR